MFNVKLLQKDLQSSDHALAVRLKTEKQQRCLIYKTEYSCAVFTFFLLLVCCLISFFFFYLSLICSKLQLDFNLELHCFGYFV